ncbi:MAG: glycerate kinase [Bacilli bacterium]
MKALVLMDSFKGSISSKKLNKIVEEELNNKNISTISFPVSDGGEGFLETLNLKNYKYLYVKNGDLKDEKLYYCYFGDNAYIELAVVCGMSNSLIKNPMYTSTYGVGELIKDAKKSGFKNIYLGIGGSSTNDLGLGIIEALGGRFYCNNELVEYITGKDLIRITSIDYSDVIKLMKGINIITLSDVNNPLIGEDGAARTYAKQKGASLEDIEILEQGAINICRVLSDNRMIEMNPYSGASGGVGYIVQRILSSKIISGIEFVFNYHNIHKHTNEVDIIVTGEGKIDKQSLQGKVINGIMNITNKPIVALVGVSELASNFHNNIKIFSIVPEVASLEYSFSNPEECIRRLIRLITI